MWKLNAAWNILGVVGGGLCCRGTLKWKRNFSKLLHSNVSVGIPS